VVAVVVVVVAVVVVAAVVVVVVVVAAVRSSGSWFVNGTSDLGSVLSLRLVVVAVLRFTATVSRLEGCLRFRGK